MLSENKIGCFKAFHNPLNEILGDLTRESLDVMIDACAQLAHNKRYKYFALGKNGMCYSGPNAQTDYFKEGPASSRKGCTHDVGDRRHNFVFTFSKYWSVVVLQRYTQLLKVRFH